MVFHGQLFGHFVGNSSQLFFLTHIFCRLFFLEASWIMDRIDKLLLWWSNNSRCESWWKWAIKRRNLLDNGFDESDIELVPVSPEQSDTNKPTLGPSLSAKRQKPSSATTTTTASSSRTGEKKFCHSSIKDFQSLEYQNQKVNCKLQFDRACETVFIYILLRQ